MRRPLSVVAVISVAAVLALSLSGCSGSPARTNTGGAHATSSSDVLAVWEQFATCARAHGVPNLPDPVPDPDGKARFPGFDGRSAARGEGLLSRPDMVRLVVGRRVGHAVAGEKGRADADPLALPSQRETEVLTCVARGQTNREIARSPSIGEETVKSHVSRVLAKLGVQDRTQAAIIALQARLVPLDEALERPALGSH